MVIGLLRRIFKRRGSYTMHDDDGYRGSTGSVIFERPEENIPKLLNASPISPILYRYIFPQTPAHPTDGDQYRNASTVRRDSSPRGSTTSAGYCSETSDDGYPRLGATSMGGESAEIGVFSEVESSPVAEVHESDYSPIVDRTLPSITPRRVSFARIMDRKAPSAPLLDRDEDSSPMTESRYMSIWGSYTPETTTTHLYPFTPATLPPRTPHRLSFANRGIRRKTLPSAPPLEHEEQTPEETDHAPAVESSSQIVESIWGSPQYSPASKDDLDRTSSPKCTPYDGGFERRERRISILRRIPSAAVSGRVKAMVLFFENDSERVEIPRRLDQISPDCMRSAPQINKYTPTPSTTTSRKHGTHSDLVRGIASSSDHCLRCDSYRRTPNSRRSMT